MFDLLDSGTWQLSQFSTNVIFTVRSLVPELSCASLIFHDYSDNVIIIVFICKFSLNDYPCVNFKNCVSDGISTECAARNLYQLFKVKCSNNSYIVGGEICQGKKILLRSHNKILKYLCQGLHMKGRLVQSQY